MIMNNENDKQVEMSEDMETIDFTIDTSNDKMFHLLSNLYSNPFGSTIKEISTNCLDAHRIHNNQERPFEIHVSGKLDDEETLSFRDFGPGMSHEDIKMIYTKFGKSTKTSTNDDTGCLGLGSKSPLSISDSFIVENYFNGKKNIYSITKNAKGIPSLVKFAEVDTLEENGMLVKIPILPTYSKRIYNEIREQLKFFKTKPKVMVEEQEYDIEWEKEIQISDYCLIDNKVYINQNDNNPDVVVQGQVQYNFSKDDLLQSLVETETGTTRTHISDNLKIDYETKELLKKLCNSYRIKMFVDTGSVSFTPNREELIYDGETVKYIVNLLIDALEKYASKTDEIIESFSCPWDARYSSRGLTYINLDSFTNETQSLLKNTSYSFMKSLHKSKKIYENSTGQFYSMLQENLDCLNQVTHISIKDMELKATKLVKESNDIVQIDLQDVAKVAASNVMILTYKEEDIVHPMKKAKIYFQINNHIKHLMLVKLYSDKKEVLDDMKLAMGLLDDNFVKFEDIIDEVNVELEKEKEQRRLDKENGIIKEGSDYVYKETIYTTSIKNMGTERSSWSSTEVAVKDLEGICIPIKNGVVFNKYTYINTANSKYTELFKYGVSRYYYINLIDFISEYINIEDINIYYLNKKNQDKATKLISIEHWLEDKLDEIKAIQDKKINLCDLTTDTLQCFEKVEKSVQNIKDDNDTFYSYDRARKAEFSDDINDWFYKKNNSYIKLYNWYLTIVKGNRNKYITKDNFELFEKLFDFEVVVHSRDAMMKKIKAMKEENPFFADLFNIKYSRGIVEVMYDINVYDYIKDQPIDLKQIPVKPKVIVPDTEDKEIKEQEAA